MIHQLRELGQFFLERQNIADPLEQFAQDPGAKFGTEVLLLVFGEGGFENVQVESYHDGLRTRFLYRKGTSNFLDATPTAGMPVRDPKVSEKEFVDALHTRLAHLGNSVRDASENVDKLGDDERHELEVIAQALPKKHSKETAEQRALRERVIHELLRKGRDESKRAFLSVAWRKPGHPLKYVGDFKAFQQQLLRFGIEGAARSRGRGQCSICGKTDVEVFGRLQVPNFQFYILDKQGSISGGFDKSKAWRNFPACAQCCARVEYSGEWIKKKLSFQFYGFWYLVLPSPVQPVERTEAFDVLRKLIPAKVDTAHRRRLTEAEDEMLDAISAEDNRLQVDLVFYTPITPQKPAFRPALYISGLLPSRFRDLFDAKEKVDAHPWLQPPGPKPFTEGSFTFKSLREIFPKRKKEGLIFDDDFLAATRAALEKTPTFPRARMLSVGMRVIQQRYLNNEHWSYLLAELFRTLLFFEYLTQQTNLNAMQLPDYGTSPQADRVRAFFANAPNQLGEKASPQAAFLIGACCGRIEDIQRRLLDGSTPFSGKLKGFRLNVFDVKRLLLDVKDKARAYGPEEEIKVIGLSECAAAALAASPDAWPLSPDEVSYYFALGHALRSRLAAEKANSEDQNQA